MEMPIETRTIIEIIITVAVFIGLLLYFTRPWIHVEEEEEE